MGNERIEQICARLAAAIQNPGSELHYSSGYHFVVAVVLSAQTTDTQVNKATASLFAKCKTIDDILDLEFEGLCAEIKSIGLYRNKAKFILELSKILKEKHNSQIPQERDQLEKLPGIGRKSANVILNTLFGQSAIAVDTHVLRLSKRLGLSAGADNPVKVERDLEAVIPEKYKKHISNLLVLHGRYVCKAKNPDCNTCILRDLCSFHFTGRR
jgi:endonuclease-3